MHVYGAYVPKRAMQLHKPKSGFHVLGFAKSVDVLADYRVLLSPLRFGAGVKGKIVDAWWCVQAACDTALRSDGIHAAREHAGENGVTAEAQATAGVRRERKRLRAGGRIARIDIDGDSLPSRCV
jgi:hypothetical protein